MSVKDIAYIQYQEIVDRAGHQMRECIVPPEGWLCTVRKALKMSGAQLARRLGVSRSQVSKTEKNELSGSVTIRTIQHMAEKMDCRFVYAIVPEKRVEDILLARAKEKATHIVSRTNEHMALEGQILSNEQIMFEIERLQMQLANNMPSDFWDDKP